MCFINKRHALHQLNAMFQIGESEAHPFTAVIYIKRNRYAGKTKQTKKLHTEKHKNCDCLNPLEVIVVQVATTNFIKIF